MNTQLRSFQVMDVLKRANELQTQGREIFHLEAGQPATSAPPAVLAAAHAALDGNKLGYVDALGLPALRTRIAQMYQARHGVTVNPARVVVTTGSSAGFVLAFMSALPPGARVGLAAPYYPAYPNILRALGFTPVIIDARESEGLQFTPAMLENETLDAIIVASPANPTGAMLDGPQLRALIDACAARKLRLISDEIYHGITYGEPARSAAEFCEEAIVINSFSKYWSMTGWRLGWILLPESLIRQAEILSQNLYISSPVLSQHAALAAFDCAEVLDGHVRRYARNRALLMERLPQLGFELRARPDGAFYIYTSLPDPCAEPMEYCMRMLDECGVAVTPGTDFDRDERGRSLRFSYAGGYDEIVSALESLSTWMASPSRSRN